ncbi:parapinopsin b isoform X1 [Nerophis ophidion]|uniref:parapinopsin b isoform X1 n=1 Tax=Nerophis ophidion TaxID=159077 RepID=UPI002AE04467|nr:parapinopsin b isoform X1 [Nerophis ophidion]XP_061730267.1 parapinopsin b isoform X1 [Nerophis ophidion]
MHDSFVTHNSSSWQGEPPLSRGGFILLSAVMALFTGPAVVLNATVIIVSLLHKQLRQPLNYALVNMAVADLGSAVTGGLLSVVHNAQGFSSLGRTSCVMEGFAVSLFGITSLCTVALIAVERMFVVCKPLGHMTFQKKHALAAIALSWIWSLTWNVPPLLGWGRYEPEGVGTSCAPDWRNRDPHHMSYILVYFTVCFAVPFVVILVSYSRLMWTLHQVSKLACLEGGAVAKKELKVASMVVLMVLTFLISWLPYAALSMLVVFNPHLEISPLVGTVPVYLAKTSTVYNPIIYIYCNKQFQRYVVPFLLCREVRTQEDTSEVVTTVEMSTNKVSPA